MKYLTNAVLILLMVACSQPKKTDAESEKPEAGMADEKISLEKVWETDTTLATPESVLYDTANEVLYVSCINGVPPNAKDGDGYIAKVNPADGAIVDSAWVTGLDAPKGLGLVGNTLYVTNIDEVVAIDITTGEITARTAVEGAEFLNDITTDPEGNVYFSDSNKNKIHQLNAEGELSTWIDDENMGGPNGLFHDGERMMLATFGSGKFNTINYDDNKVIPVVDSIPGGDGIVKVGVDFLVSNWNGEVYYVTADWDKTKILDTKAMGANAADIEFIKSSNTLLVPTFFGNQVVAYQLKN